MSPAHQTVTAPRLCLSPTCDGSNGTGGPRDSEETRRFRVGPEAVGKRLDRYLAAQMVGHTRSAIRRLITGGRVRVDGAPATKAGVELEAAMEITVSLPPTPDREPAPERIPIDVVYEDDCLLVVNKPAGLVVHPGHGCREGTLVNALLGRGTVLSPRGAPDRPGIVHRLDRETSGLLVVAKTEPVHAALSEAFARREISKRYEALVWGHPDPEHGRIERRIGRSRANPVKMAISGRGSREAFTQYATRERLIGFSLLDLRPETGRTHQIRVHLQSIHHPIVGDTRYGGRMWKGVQDPLKRKALARFDRLALHAFQLAFVHPASGREMAFTAPRPDELDALIRVLRRG